MQKDVMTSTQTLLVPKQSWSRSATGDKTIRFLGYALLLVMAGGLLLVNLTTYPLPWFDEGYFMAVAKTLVRDGLYALPDSAGPWVMDPSITTGPSIIVPLALVFKLFGIGILQARLTAVMFGVLGLIAYSLLARRLVGAAWLVAALLLLAGNPELYTSYAFLARQMVGEVAALSLWVYGAWLWLRTSDSVRPRWWQWACVGLAFGLAIITKPQMIVGIAPALALTCLLDRCYYRQASWRAYIIPGVVMLACFGGWYAAQLAIAGAATMQRGNAVLQSGVRSNILGFDLVHIKHALGTIWRSGFWLWGLPGLAYGAWLARRRDRQGLAHAWLLTLVTLWLGWYVVFSIGWSRYAFVPFALTTIWTAGLAGAAWQRATKPGRLLLATLLAALLIGNSYTLVKSIGGAQDRSAAEISAYLTASLPADAVIESWEWNLDSTAPQRFHHPPPLVMYRVIDLIQREQPVPKDIYDPAAAGAPYIIDGPFSSWTGVYHDYVTARGVKVMQIGGYALYRVRQ